MKTEDFKWQWTGIGISIGAGVGLVLGLLVSGRDRARYRNRRRDRHGARCGGGRSGPSKALIALNAIRTAPPTSPISTDHA